MLWFRRHVLRRRMSADGRSERGATAVEYGLIVALFALGMFGVVKVLQTSLTTSYSASESRVGAPQSQLAAPTLPSYDAGACGSDKWPNPLTGACETKSTCDPVTEVWNQATNGCDVKPTATPTPTNTATVPSQPAAPTGTAANSSVGLTWTAPADGGSPITSYAIQYQAGTSGTWNATASTSTNVTISGLVNGTTYYFQVRAINAVGASAWSSSSAGVTPRSVPGAPTNLQGVADASQVALTWTAPTDNGGSAITDYLIQYKQGTSGSWQTFPHVASTATSATVTGLTNGQQYYFQVAAINAAGTGSFSTQAGPYTPVAPTAPATPGAPTCVPANGQITINWAAPDDGGSAITQYQLQSRTGTSGAWQDRSTGSTSTTYTWTGRTNGTQYTFQVRARNGVGWSAYSPASAICAAATVPSAPAKPTVARAGSQSITVTWVEPNDGGSAITNYEVSYGTTTAANAATTTTTSTSATISGLANGTQYYFKVRALNAIGWGPYSPVSDPISPAGTAPATPDAPTCVASSGQLVVSWNAPDDGGSPITTYRLQRSANGTSGWGSNVNTPSTSTTVSGLTNGTSYYFRVRATNAVGSSSYSAVASCKPATVPSAPAKPTVARAGSQSITVTWVEPNDGGSAITNYEVSYGTTTAANAATTTTTSTSATISGLADGTQYYFKVRALNAIGWGGFSPVSDAITPKAPYGGTTPNTRYPASGYRSQGDNSSLTLSALVGSITGISYTSLSGAPSNVSLNSSTGVITFGNWNNNNTAITVNWSIAETSTTLGTSGSFTLYVT